MQPSEQYKFRISEHGRKILIDEWAVAVGASQKAAFC